MECGFDLKPRLSRAELAAQLDFEPRVARVVGAGREGEVRALARRSPWGDDVFVRKTYGDPILARESHRQLHVLRRMRPHTMDFIGVRAYRGGFSVEMELLEGRDILTIARDPSLPSELKALTFARGVVAMDAFGEEMQRLGLRINHERDPETPSLLVQGTWEGEALDFGLALDNILVEFGTGRLVALDIDASEPKTLECSKSLLDARLRE